LLNKIHPTERPRVGDLRKVWVIGNSFGLSIDEDYIAELRNHLTAFRPKSLLILDDAHHAARSSCRRHATDSQFTSLTEEDRRRSPRL
jgi:hypothetical protein